MSKDNFKSFDSPEEGKADIRKELESFFAHVLEHDPNSLRFALMLAGHTNADGSTHVCSMGGGSPVDICSAILEAVDKVIEIEPQTGILLILGILDRLQRLANKQKNVRNELDSVEKADTAGVDSKKAFDTVSQLLETFQKKGGPSVH